MMKAECYFNRSMGYPSVSVFQDLALYASRDVRQTSGEGPKLRMRYTPLGSADTPGSWLTETRTQARTAAPVNSLTPGTTYAFAFQVRALGKLGYTDWSDSATRMCT